MTYKDVLKLAADIDEATDGDFLSDYCIGGKITSDHDLIVKIIKIKDQKTVASGSPNDIYSGLMLFYLGMRYGLRQGVKLFDKYKVDVGEELAQLLHIKECRVDEPEDKEVGNE